MCYTRNYREGKYLLDMSTLCMHVTAYMKGLYSHGESITFSVLNMFRKKMKFMCKL